MEEIKTLTELPIQAIAIAIVVVIASILTVIGGPLFWLVWTISGYVARFEAHADADLKVYRDLAADIGELTKHGRENDQELFGKIDDLKTDLGRISGQIGYLSGKVGAPPD